jgi:hypothetical protein
MSAARDRAPEVSPPPHGVETGAGPTGASNGAAVYEAEIRGRVLRIEIEGDELTLHGEGVTLVDEYLAHEWAVDRDLMPPADYDDIHPLRPR